MPSDRHALGQSEDPLMSVPSLSGECRPSRAPNSKVFPHVKRVSQESPEVTLCRKRGEVAQAMSSGLLFPEGNPYRRD